MRPVWILLAVIFLFSCKKNDHDPLPKKTTTELLTQKPWMFSGFGFDENHNGVIDPNENLITDCVKDNTLNYKNDGTGTVQDNANTCSPTADNLFNWVLKDNDSKIEVNGQPYFILRIAENDMQWKVDMPGFSNDFLLTYIH